MFLDSEFETAQDGEQVILNCNPLEEAKIRNHTCTLAPEVTQGKFPVQLSEDLGHRADPSLCRSLLPRWRTSYKTKYGRRSTRFAFRMSAFHFLLYPPSNPVVFSSS